jgi:histone H2B
MTSSKKATKPSRSFATYIQKVLKQIHPDGGMSLQSMDTVDSILRYFAKLFARDARVLALDNDTKTISSREICTAVQLLFTTELASNATSEGQKALDKYDLFETNRTNDKSENSMKAPKTMKQTKAGLLCSVSLVESHLRFQGVNVGQGAPVYLAAVLEHL